MSRGWRCALLMVAWTTAVGCSTLRRQEYYAPAASSGILVSSAEVRCGGQRGRAVSGPPARILLTRPGVTLGLEAFPVASRTVTAGPLMLPVLPALPPSAFPQIEARRGHPVVLVLRVIEPADSSGLDLDAMTITLEPERGRAVSYGTADTVQEFVAFEDGPSEWQLSDGVELTHRWGSGDPRVFRVRIAGVVLDGEPVAFPPVTFRKTRGWVMCEDSFSDLTREARAEARHKPPPETEPAPQPAPR